MMKMRSAFLFFFLFIVATAARFKNNVKDGVISHDETVKRRLMMAWVEHLKWDLIRNLCDKGRQLDAIKLAFAFGVLAKFPPRPILTAYLKNAKKHGQKIRKEGEAASRECSNVKAMIKCIEEHNLESEYPLESLEKHVKDLTKQRTFGKHMIKCISYIFRSEIEDKLSELQK